MSNLSELTSKIFEYLNVNINYAVLRNYEGLPLRNNSRDIDILIERVDFFNIENEIIDIIMDCGFNIPTLYKSEKVVTYVCSFTSKDVVDLLQFDFFFNTSLFGIILLDSERVLSSKLFNGDIYHVSKEYEFLDKYLQVKFLNKIYPHKYSELKNDMKKSKFMSNILMDIIRCDSIETLDRLPLLMFKLRFLYFNLRKNPFKQIYLFTSFCFNYFNNFLKYKGISISFSGPDGAGKTTIIDMIVLELSQTYPSIEKFHFRPTITPNLGEAAFKIKLKSEVDRNYSMPHRGKKIGVFNSFIRLIYYYIDYFFGYLIRVRPSLQRRSIVIFDRYFTDIITDSQRSSIFLNHKFLYFFGKLFIPKMDYNILLTADQNIILKRKQELDSEGIMRINKKLNYLSSKEGYFLILNNGRPKDAVHNILSSIFEEQHKKNIKHFLL